MRTLIFLSFFFITEARALEVVTKKGLRSIDEAVYTQTLSLLKSGIEDQILATLEASPPASQGLKLKKISVGVRASGDVGLGPWSLGANVRQRFIFER